MSEAAIWRLHRFPATEVSILAPFAEESGYAFVLDLGAKAKDVIHPGESDRRISG
jgi:hypothetical protein